MGPRISALYTYPIKGLNPHALTRVELEPGGTFPVDRAFALRRGEWPFDPARPEYVFKTNFYMLMRDEALAKVKAEYDLEAGTIRLANDQDRLSADPSTEAGRTAIEDFFERLLGTRPSLVAAPNHSFCDTTAKVVSFINLAGVRELSRAVGSDLDPIRFRANVYFECDRAWEEFSWVGKTFRAGGAVFRGLRRISRCAATSVNPETALRDQNIPKALVSHFGHNDMGLYAEVLAPGVLAVGDEIRIG